MGTGLVGVFGAEALCDDPAPDRERHLAGGGLDRLEIDAVERARADQAFGFGGDLGRDLGLEPLFLAGGGGVSARSRVWQIASLTSISSRVRSRSR